VCSYALCADGSLSASDVVTPPRAAAAALATALSALVDPPASDAPTTQMPPTPPSLSSSSSYDTWVYLTAQAGFAGLRSDERMLSALLGAAPPGGQLRLSTPYCNLTAATERALGAASVARVTLLTAAPEAHGFAGAAGAAALVPDAYGVMVRAPKVHRSVAVCVASRAPYGAHAADAYARTHARTHTHTHTHRPL
jgi:hypothetical protein